MPAHPQYRSLWGQAGYGLAMGSAEVVPPPAKEYLLIYHITALEYGLSDLKHQRLKIARFADANDPFELLALNVRDKPTRKKLVDFKTSYSDATGLLCFSADWTDPVLWSHYGTKHRGICLGFDVLRPRVEEVEYKVERIRSELGDDPTDSTEISEALRRQLLCTKYANWKYEQEKRIFVALNEPYVQKEGAFYFYPFSEGLQLREVILGAQCEGVLKDVRGLVDVNYKGVTTIKARIAYGSFHVVPNMTTVP